MKKRIGILSFPTACNHGAFLQVYALREYLISKGHKVEVINYRNKIHYKNEMKSMFIKKDITLIYYNLLRFLSFRSSQKAFNMKKMTFDITNINSYEFDCLIVGGDIVWDFENPYLGHDSAFFGNLIQSKKLITYAASAGSSKAKNMSNYVKDGIKKFDSLGVRDKETLKIAQSNNDCPKKIVLDTTLIYDFPLEDKRIYIEDYILLYSFEMSKKDQEEIIGFASNRSLKIVSITFNKNYKWADKNFYSISPLDTLNLIKNASYIFTSTFHGLLLSLKYRKRIALRNNETIKSKCGWLIDTLDISKIDIKETSNIQYIWNNENIYTQKFEITFSNLINSSRNFLDICIKD